jgi:hypothetical protein
MELLDQFLKWLNSNPWLNLVFLFLSVFSIIISFYLFFKSKKRKIPTYLLKTFNLIRDRVNKIEEVKITYTNQQIKNFSITKAAIWNKGNEIINKTDIAPKDPIRLIIQDEYEILNAQITFVKNEANNFSISIAKDRKSLLIDFDYIYKDEGFTFEVYHTGFSGKNIELKGRIKDAPKFSTAEFNKDFMLDYIFDNTFGLLRNSLSDKGWKIYFFSILPIVFPIAVATVPIQMIYGLAKRNPVPSEYTLKDEE